MSWDDEYQDGQWALLPTQSPAMEILFYVLVVACILLVVCAMYEAYQQCCSGARPEDEETELIVMRAAPTPVTAPSCGEAVGPAGHHRCHHHHHHQDGTRHHHHHHRILEEYSRQTAPPVGYQSFDPAGRQPLYGHAPSCNCAGGGRYAPAPPYASAPSLAPAQSQRPLHGPDAAASPGLLEERPPPYAPTQ